MCVYSATDKAKDVYGNVYVKVCRMLEHCFIEKVNDENFSKGNTR